MFKQNYYLFLALEFSALLFTSTSYAHCWHYCPTSDDWTLLSERIQYTGPCQLSQKLQLGRIDHEYPAMNGSKLTVDYWQGAYAKPAKITRTYRVDTYNCWGSLLNSQTITQGPEAFSASFAVDNPNLHEDVSASFVANAPMTDLEAKQALTQAKKDCESAK